MDTNRKSDTELSNKFWKIKDNKRSANITWEILDRHQAYNNTSSKRCSSLYLNEKLKIALHRNDNMLSKQTKILSKCRHKKQLCTNIIWSHRAELSFLLKFPWNASHKITVSRNLAGFSFLVVHQISWPGFLVKPFRENFNMMSYYAEDWRRLKIAAVTTWNFSFQINCFLYLETFEVYISFRYTHVITSTKFRLKQTWRLTKAIAEMKCDTEQTMKLE